MFNFLDNLKKFSDYYYSIQTDGAWKVFIYFFFSISILFLIRNQFPEIEFLQYFPGFYIFFLFFIFLIFLTCSDKLFLLIYIFETQFKYGIKSKEKMKIISIIKNLFFFLLSFLSIGFTSFIPLSIETLNDYSIENLEDLWSFTQIILLQLFFFFLIVIFSQFPILIRYFLITEKTIFYFLKTYKIITLFTVILVGILTPTVDIFSQFFVVICISILYSFLLIQAKKNCNLKFSESFSLTF